MKPITMKSTPLKLLLGALLLVAVSQTASAHPESRSRIGVGLSLFFPHVGLHLGTSTGGRGNHRHDHRHNDGHAQHGYQNEPHRRKSAEHDHSAYRSSQHKAPVTRHGPRSKPRAQNHSAHTQKKSQARSKPIHKGQYDPHYCARADADAAHCLSEMRSDR